MTEPEFPEGNAIVYCEGAFGTTNGKTAHGLVRRSKRYRVLSVVDSKSAGVDAGSALPDRDFRIIEQALLIGGQRQALRNGGVRRLRCHESVLLAKILRRNFFA